MNDISTFLKSNDVNYGASTSGVNISPELSEKLFSTNMHDTETIQNQTRPNSNNNIKDISLTPEEIAMEQTIWVNRMYAIQMAEYWQT